MKITAVSVQARDKDRVNVSVDGKYRFSLSIFQLGELKIKLGNEYSAEEIEAFEVDSQFGKLYARALEYCLSRPHSEKEVRDYLYKKTLSKRSKTGSVVPGVSKDITARVFAKLVDKKYVDDSEFTRFWVDNRSRRKGISRKKLIYELRSKGVAQTVIDEYINMSDRTDTEEIQKIIEKKRAKYGDDKKLMAYLARQGFSYDDIRVAMGD